jgi:Domain of unknown function (DUF4440)
MTIARARQFLDAVVAHDFEAAEELLDPHVETVTPRGTVRGIQASPEGLRVRSRRSWEMTEHVSPPADVRLRKRALPSLR